MHLSHMHAPRKGHGNAQQEGSHIRTRKRALGWNQISQHLDLGLSRYQNWEKYMFVVLAIYGILF